MVRNGRRKGYTDAQYNLALMYLKGVGVKESKKEAVKLLREAARKGDDDSQSVLKDLGEKW